MSYLKKQKKHSQTYYRKKCVTWAKDDAKKRDNYTCQYCGKTKIQGWQIHGSHIKPEGSYPSLSADPENIIALCATHHLAGMSRMIGNSKEPSWHGDPLYMADWFNKKYPGLKEKLNKKAIESLKHIINWEQRWNIIKKYK